MVGASDPGFTVFLDPNYNPSSSYPHLEGWLLLYDHIYVASPSPHQLELASAAANLSSLDATIQRLVRESWVVPVGRPRFFSEAWRHERTSELEKQDPARAEHFRWNGPFDVLMASHKHLLDDAGLDRAIEEATEIEYRYPDAFEWLRRKVAALKADHQLPAKFYMPSEVDRPVDETTRGVIYEVAGDIWARKYLNANGLIVPHDHGGIYGLFDRALPDSIPFVPQFVATSIETAHELSPEDERLARELAERISARYSISDVLAEYRGSGLQTQFRQFVLTAMLHLRNTAEGSEPGEYLVKRVDDQIAHIEGMDTVGAILGATGLGSARIHPSVAKLLGAGITRRSILAVMLFAAGGLAGGPLLGPAIDGAESAITGEADRWIALIGRRARRR
jgi:hypothetical protein